MSPIKIITFGSDGFKCNAEGGSAIVGGSVRARMREVELF